MINSFELTPNDRHKSFYGKTTVISDGRHYWLRSYNTIVMRYDSDSNTFHRLWWGWSATTARHVDAFLAYLRHHTISKSEWETMPVEEDRTMWCGEWRYAK
jgi:hypothetical protein